MKKATAFLSFIGFLCIPIIYFVKFHSNPELLTPLFDWLKALIPTAYHSTALIAGALFWLTGFVTSIAGMFSGNKEKSEVKEPQTDPTVREPAKVEIKKPEEEPKEKMVPESELIEKNKAFEHAEMKITALESEIENYKTQLEKFNVNEVEKAEIDDLKNDLHNTQKALEASEEKEKKLETELEALAAKIEKSQEKMEQARKEKEKVAKKLKTTENQFNEMSDKYSELKEENERLSEDLRAAEADAKSGKHGIPPAAYQILYLFQKEGRFIDLMMEDISEFDDETLGGAIRPIHEGCHKILKERLIIEPVLNDEEGSEITIEEADPESIKLSGNVPAEGPYKGELVHRGWRLKECHLPELVDGWTGNVVAPAEIEID
jgi:hypothetical protein